MILSVIMTGYFTKCMRKSIHSCIEIEFTVYNSSSLDIFGKSILFKTECFVITPWLYIEKTLLVTIVGQILNQVVSLILQRQTTSRDECDTGKAFYSFFQKKTMASSLSYDKVKRSKPSERIVHGKFGHYKQSKFNACIQKAHSHSHLLSVT